MLEATPPIPTEFYIRFLFGDTDDSSNMVTNLEKATSERDTLKSTLKWLEDKVKEDGTIEEVESWTEALETIKSSLAKVHVRVVETLPTDLADQEKQYFDMMDRILKLEITLKKMTKAFANSGTSIKSKVKLPEIKLPSFLGE